MNRLHKQRIIFLIFFAVGLSLAATCILYALKKNINLFVTPSELLAAHVASDDYFKLGGMVKKDSVQHAANGIGVKFIVTDLKQEIPVYFNGVLPDLFREGKGIVAEGKFSQGIFIANQVLAKHDENYMPRKVYEKMRSSSLRGAAGDEANQKERYWIASSPAAPRNDGKYKNEKIQS